MRTAEVWFFNMKQYENYASQQQWRMKMGASGSGGKGNQSEERPNSMW